MLKGKKINLRVIEEKDLETYIELNNDFESVGEHSTPFINSPVQIKKGFAEHGFWQRDSARMLITTKEDEIVGTIGFSKGKHYSTGVGLGAEIYKPENRRQGYMSEAIKLFCYYLYEAHAFERIELSTMVDNIGAQKVAERAGFIYEGTRRNASRTKGQLVDLKMYSLLRGELKN